MKFFLYFSLFLFCLNVFGDEFLVTLDTNNFLNGNYPFITTRVSGTNKQPDFKIFSILSVSSNQSVFQGDSFNFKVLTASTATPNYQWLVGGTNIAAATNYNFSSYASSSNVYTLLIYPPVGSIVTQQFILDVKSLNSLVLSNLNVNYQIFTTSFFVFGSPKQIEIFSSYDLNTWVSEKKPFINTNNSYFYEEILLLDKPKKFFKAKYL